MCGDATNKEQMRQLMQDQKADMIFTDPPYNLSFSGTIHGQFNEMENDAVPDEEYQKFTDQLTTRMLEHSKPETSIYICIDYRNYPIWYNALKNQQLDIINCIVWDKIFAGMGYKYRLRHEFIIFAGHRNKIPWHGTTIDEDIIKIQTRKASETTRVLDRKGCSMALKDGSFIRVKIEEKTPFAFPSSKQPKSNLEQTITQKTPTSSKALA